MASTSHDVSEGALLCPHVDDNSNRAGHYARCEPAIELHEVKGPEYEIVLGPFVNLSMELLKAVRMN
jgi:hypothetical protein